MHPKAAGRLKQALLVLLVGLTGLSILLLAGQAITPQPIQFLGLTIDRLSAVMGLLVAGIGAVTYHFALRYLDGEPEHRLFMRWLGFTVVIAYLLMFATNLLLLFIAWSLTSMGLHKLLTFYHDRPEAQRPARKKFLISRLGDVALLGAIALVWVQWGTLDLHIFLDRVVADGAALPGVTGVALLIVVAALTKSAQFPFHSWLPETMEAPTPVSALMHAGIINAGGVLLLRFAPVIVVVPEALLMLAFVGTLTAVLGVITMWAQTKVKRTLAWSTVSQMGFMMVQCGLAAFPAALLHIVGHGCYKAWSFLRTGDLPRQSPSMPDAPGRTLGLGLIGVLLAVPALALAARITGFDPFHSPGELALSAIVALSIGQLWIALLRNTGNGAIVLRVISAVGATVLVAVGAFALYHGAILFLAPVYGELPVPTGVLAWAAAILPVIAFAALAILHALLPALGRSASGRAFHVHALHGFYFGLVADRVVDRIWRSFATGRM